MHSDAFLYLSDGFTQRMQVSKCQKLLIGELNVISDQSDLNLVESVYLMLSEILHSQKVKGKKMGYLACHKKTNGGSFFKDLIVSMLLMNI